MMRRALLEWAKVIAGAAAILFGLWAIGAAAGMVYVGFCWVAGCPL